MFSLHFLFASGALAVKRHTAGQDRIRSRNPHNPISDGVGLSFQGVIDRADGQFGLEIYVCVRDGNSGEVPGRCGTSE